MLEISHLSKRIEDKQIIANMDFTLEKGQIVALLGPNGAGKTTTIKLILGLLNPTTGNILVDKISITEDRNNYLRKIGYVSDEPFFYEELTGQDFIKFTSELWGGNISINTPYHTDLLTKLNMDSYINDPIHSYSYGMKKKLSVYISLLHNPDYVIMDEPFNGIDPKTTNDLYHTLELYAKTGKGLLLSTHMLEIAEKFCTHAVIMDKGEIIFYDELDKIVKENNNTLETMFLEKLEEDK